jgi:branched-chain amino acid transport system permease protein
VNLSRALADGLRAALGVPAAAYALAAIGLNLQYGYTGLFNAGQVGFLLVGAYGTAIAVTQGLPLPAGLAVGVAAAVALGLVMGLPTLRLRADYLAIVTISVSEILRLLARARPFASVTGGPFGLRGFAEDFFAWNPIPPGRYGVGDVAFSARNLWVMAVGWALVAIGAAFVVRLIHSPWGRVVRAVREDEDAARAVGKPTFVVKLQSLLIGGVIGSFGGILIALDAQFVDSEFWITAVTFFTLTIVILGGPATGLGPVLGAVLFWFLLASIDTLLRDALATGPLAGALGPNDAGPIRFALVGVALAALAVFRPQGVLGRREEQLLDAR